VYTANKGDEQKMEQTYLLFYPENKQKYEALVKEIVLECIEKMSDDDCAYIRTHPDITRYHFGYGMYIRNTYGPRFDRVDEQISRDDMSGDVLSEIVKVLLPEYQEIPLIYNELEFCGVANQIHKYSYARYSRCAVDIFAKHYKHLSDAEEYKQTHDYYPDEYLKLKTPEEKTAYRKHNEVEIEKSRKDYYNKLWKIKDRFKPAIAEEFWDFSNLTKEAYRLNIPGPVINEYCQLCRNALKEAWEHVLPSSLLLLYNIDSLSDEMKDGIAHEIAMLFDLHGEEKIAFLPKWLFSVRFFVKAAVIENGLLLKYTSDFIDDIDIVQTAISSTYKAIKYASERLKQDRILIKQIIETEKDEVVFYGDVFDEYKDDDELVMLAIEQNGANIAFVSERFRDDYNTVKHALKRSCSRVFTGTAYESLKEKYRDDKELAILMIMSCKDNIFVPVDSMSERLRDDDEIAELLCKHKYSDYLLKEMSIRIQEQYIAKNE